MLDKTFLFLLFTLLSLNSFASAKVNTKTAKPLPRLTIPHERYTLDNGLSVILSQDKSTPFVATSLWYQVGAVNEKPKKTGLAHLFEHLMFEGSTHIGADEHFKRLESAGAFSVNASTGFDRTNYYQTVPKSQLELTLALESSRMYFLNISQEKLDEQRAVVRREREQRYETSPYGLATLGLWQSIFPTNSPLHGRVIGSHEDLQAASVDDVRSFYDKYYGPSNACLTLVGDFDITEAKTLINKYFSTLPSSMKQSAPAIPKVVLDTQETIEVEEKLGRLPLVRMQYITPALFKKGDAELDILSHILSGGEQGRLNQAITRDSQLASNVSAYQQSMEQISVFTIDAVLNNGVSGKTAIKGIDKVLSNLLTNPPSQVEIDRARNSILTDFFFGLQNVGGNNGKAELLQSYNRYAKDSNFIEKDLARYQSITRDDMIAAIKRYVPVGSARKILIATPSSQTVAQKGL